MLHVTLTDTLTDRRTIFRPSKPSRVTLYVCGITPYDYAHMGHGRVYVTFDVLCRLLTYLGYTVSYCRNFTDIDDKLLARSQAEFGDEKRFVEIADRYIDSYHRDMKNLGCLLPQYEPRVTEHIPEIITFVQKLIDQEKAYISGDDVYFSINQYPSYGKLSKRKLEDLAIGVRVAVNEKKRNPLDFALWKSAPQSSAGWESPWGWGRPGWHIECSALALKYLGETVDIHAGGMDLIFPHHENEIAQSEALTHKPFARYWLHNAFVQINKEKMSKSLGNFFTLQDLFKQFDPMVIRYVFLQHQYRNPLDFSLDDLAAAQKSYQRLCRIMGNADTLTSVAVSELLPIPQRMLEFLCDDLNTPGLFGVVFENSALLQEDMQLRDQVAYLLKNILGLTLNFVEKVVNITPAIQALLDEREAARVRKDWRRADELRDQLKSLGVEVHDKKGEN